MPALPDLRSLHFPMPVSGWRLLALLALFLLPGIVGHDPWKSEDAAHFGVVWRALDSGNWLTFRFITDPVIEPPLFYWVAKLSALAFAKVLTTADAVRLATPLFAAAACASLFVAARELYGREVAAAAPLAFVGCLGFLVVSHDTQPMMAALTGLSATYAGLALMPRRLLAGAGLLGAGWATLVLGHGLTLLPAALLTAAAACVFAGEQRKAVVVGTLVAAALAAALAAPWFVLTAAASPSALQDWLAAEISRLSSATLPWDKAVAQTKLLSWFAWPALPLAAWAVWNERRKLFTFPLALPLSAFALVLANLLLVSEPRHLPTLATLPPLAVLAASGMTSLRRGAANGFDWFGRSTFTVTASLVWLGWGAMTFGVPPKIANNFAKQAPGFSLPLDLLAVAIGAVATVIWLWMCLATSREPLRSLARWTAGITLLWFLAMLLWLPWINHGKSYRNVAAAIARAAPQADACILARGLGEAQYASLDYLLPDRLVAEAAGKGRCRYLVTQGSRDEVPPGEAWRKLWEGARPGDKNERIRLYAARPGSGKPATAPMRREN